MKIKILIVFIIFLSLLPAISFSESQPPTPSPTVFGKTEQPQKKPTTKATESDAKKHGTEEFPFVVKTKESNKAENIKDGNTTTTDNEPAVDWWTRALIGFTGLIALFNLGLLIANYKLWKATKKSADALPTIERAYVFVNINGRVRIALVESSTEEPKRYFDVPINLINEGKTPAVLIKICVGIIITMDKPTIATTKNIIKEIPFNLLRGDNDKRVIRGGGEWNITAEIENISDSDFLEVLNAEQRSDPPRLFCCGKIIYKDVMKDLHITWSCWEYGKGSTSFSRADNDEMNDYT